jgi:hypothetical protein
MLSRRDLVGKLAAGAAVAWAASFARAGFASTRRGPNAPSGSGSGEMPRSTRERADAPQATDSALPATSTAKAPWEFLHPLGVGSAAAYGWRVAGLTGPVDGSCVLTLRNERDREMRVHLCRNDGHPQGIVYTNRLDLVVMNGGQGDLPTDEGFAQAVAEVAHVLAANESDRRRDPVVTSLLSQAERLRLYGSAADPRLR